MIHPSRPAALLLLLYRYRWLVYELVVRDLTLRYRGSFLGFAWTLLNPVLFMGVYVLVFGVYLNIGIPDYAVFLLSGLLPWTWFATSMAQGTSSILDGRMYVGKTIFPAEVLVVVPVVSNFLNFMLSLPLLLVVAWCFHRPVGLALVELPLIVACEALISTALLFFFATLTVFYRDFQQLVNYIVLLLFYLIPIFYPLARVPDAMRPFVRANPLAEMVLAYQNIFYDGKFSDPWSLAYLIFVSLVLVAAGHATFAKKRESLGEHV